MPLRAPNGAKFEDFDACVTAISGEDTSEQAARQICGSFEEIDKSQETERSVVEKTIELLDDLRGISRGETDGPDGVVFEKGDTIASLLDKAIDMAANTDRSRSDIVQSMAEKADVTTEAINQWVSGDIACPDLEALSKATRQLPVDRNTLIVAGRADGCDYSKGGLFKEDDDVSEDGEEITFEKSLSDIRKVDEEKQLVGGTIVKADRPDADGTVFPSQVVEELLHDFMQKSQTMGVAHEIETEDVVLVEAWTAKTDFQWDDTEVQKGDALGIAKVLDKDLWELAKDGRLNSFSIEGKATAIKETN